MTLITKKAPNFTAPAVMQNGKIIENFNLKTFIKNKTAIIFFWPLNFTFVCPTEIILFNKKYENIEKRNTKIIGISCDSVFSHQKWRSTPLKEGGIGNIKYPMVSDIKKNIMNMYDVEHPELGVALRASFIIDKHGIIRYQNINDLAFGRNIDEIIRMIDAIHFYEKHGEVCPAQWKKGDKGIHQTKEDVIKYLTKNF
ncbi:MAG: alkyl hydroperoxide reductase, AhpC component [Candidatus Westeberhardia cardiocondylae]|nr:alkyl hydroperoxide reductase, AhpC component [Candidatus Westeberhardia cardiocondylae]